jgi:hypothetical protein
MNEDVLKKIKELIRSKMPSVSRDKLESFTGMCINGIREYLKDFTKFNALIKKLTEDTSFHFRVDAFITEVKRNQRGDNPVKGEKGDLEPYKKGFVYVTFRLSGEEPENQERINGELDRYSHFLANSRLIDCKALNGHIFKRYLTRSEYEEISGLRLSAGTGKLRPYAEVKYIDEESEPDTERTAEAVKPVMESMKTKFWYDEPAYEADPGF